MFTETNRKKTDAVVILADRSAHGQELLVPTLISIGKLTRALLGVELATIGLHQGQDELLMALERDEAVPVSALADKLCVRPSTVSKMLDRLVLKNFVVRASSPRDARQTLIQATPEGIAAKSRIVEVWSRIETCLVVQQQSDAMRRRHFSSVEALLKARLSRLR